MKRFKQFLLAILLVVTYTTSCTSRYPEVEYEGDTGDVTFENIEDKVAIQVAVNEPLYESLTTRGVGAFEDLKAGVTGDKRWMDADFYVYAFYTPNSRLQEPVNYKERMDAEDDEKIHCLVDDTQRDSQGNNRGLGHGKKARLNRDMVSFLQWTDNDILYYNKTYQDLRYNFFAYFLDDAADFSVAPNRQTDQVSYKIQIDGTQDLMCGYASLTDEQRERFLSPEDTDFYNRLDDITYSTLTGHRDVYPIFNIKHQLAFLKFHLKAGQANGIVDKEVKHVEIVNISIMTPTKGEIVVAADDYSKIGAKITEEQKELYMPIKVKTDNNGTPIKDDQGKYIMVARSEEGIVIPGTDAGFPSYLKAEVEVTEVGMGFLVPAAENYALKLRCRQLKFNTDGTPQLDDKGNPIIISYTTTYTLKLKEDTFKPGHMYNITIHVFGHQKIQLELGDITWISGGDVVIDDEETGSEHDMQYEYD